MKALQVMVQTYTQTPKFGDVKKFQGELETAAHRVQVLESELNAFKTELADVNNALENIRSKSPLVSRKHSTQSQLSNSSSSSPQLSTDSPTLGSGWGDDFRDISELPPPQPNQPTSIPIPPPMQDASVPAPPPPPPPPGAPMQDDKEPNLRKVVALYQFDSEAPDTLPMAVGEEFFVIDDDQDGWTKVERVDHTEEGFVPSSFIQNM